MIKLYFSNPVVLSFTLIKWYTEDMKSSNLELIFSFLEDDNKILGPITIKGVVSTSMKLEWWD